MFGTSTSWLVLVWWCFWWCWFLWFLFFFTVGVESVSKFVRLTWPRILGEWWYLTINTDIVDTTTVVANNICNTFRPNAWRRCCRILLPFSPSSEVLLPVLLLLLYVLLFGPSPPAAEPVGCIHNNMMCVWRFRLWQITLVHLANHSYCCSFVLRTGTQNVIQDLQTMKNDEFVKTGTMKQSCARVSWMDLVLFTCSVFGSGSGWIAALKHFMMCILYL